MSARTLDPYATLGIPAGASRAEAARAHRSLAKQFHPDINHGPAAAELFFIGTWLRTIAP